MQIINNVNSITFSHNGRNYVKNFIIIKQGATNIAIHNSFDTRHQLVSSTHYSQFNVDGIVYGSQADLMEALSPILFSKAGVNGEITTTSQLINDGENGIHPFITANQLPQANQILNENGYSLSGETLTMYSGWVWTIENIQYMNNVDVDLSVPEASSGTTRIDIVVATSGNTFDIIQGTEVVENPVAPPVPVGTLLATFIYVGDSTTETIIQPTPIGDDYLPKANEYLAYLSGTGVKPYLKLKDYTNYIFKDSASISEVQSVSFISSISPYIGKRIRFTNKQSTPITFKHNGGTGTHQFDLINGSDFILKSDETIYFLLDVNNNKLIQTIQINPINLVEPTGLEKLTEGSNTGWRLIGRNPALFGNIGNNAVDFSNSIFSSSTYGATGKHSIAIGEGVTASNDYTFACGNVITSSGQFAFSHGFANTSSGRYSTTFGDFNQAKTKSEFVAGMYASIINGNSNSIIATDPIYRIGIGISEFDRKDGLRMYKNGAFYLYPSVLSSVTNGSNGFIKLDENSTMHIHNGTQWNEIAKQSAVDNKISKYSGTTYNTNAIQTLTQAEYDALSGSTSSDTLYFII